jgi:hypothetical protein
VDPGMMLSFSWDLRHSFTFSRGADRSMSLPTD